MIDNIWEDAAQDNAQITSRAFYEALTPYFSDGAYLNVTVEDTADGVRRAYGANYERLVALKNTYDPSNVFRFNQNIAPSQAERSDSYALTTDRWRTGAGSRSAASSS